MDSTRSRCASCSSTFRKLRVIWARTSSYGIALRSTLSTTSLLWINNSISRRYDPVTVLVATSIVWLGPSRFCASCISSNHTRVAGAECPSAKVVWRITLASTLDNYNLCAACWAFCRFSCAMRSIPCAYTANCWSFIFARFSYDFIKKIDRTEL